MLILVRRVHAAEGLSLLVVYSDLSLIPLGFSEKGKRKASLVPFRLPEVLHPRQPAHQTGQARIRSEIRRSNSTTATR